jgi:hypothetical protein
MSSLFFFLDEKEPKNACAQSRSKAHRAFAGPRWALRAYTHLMG